MSNQDPGSVDRRTFIQGTVAASTVAASLSSARNVAGQEAAPENAGAAKPVLPTRVLGKTGVAVTLLNEGTVRAPSALDRLLRYAHGRGVRYFDTAAGYGTEAGFKRWFETMPGVRESIFLATKHGIKNDPADMLKRIDERLAALGTDYIDLLFFHGLNGDQVDWPKSQAMMRACEAIKKTGKVRFVGFTTHDATRAQQIQNAAEGGFVDVIMLQFTPWLERDSDLNRALDACHAKNIGLVSMKQFAGHNLNQVYERAPILKEKGLNPHQGLLHAIWSDERIASACVTMMNLDEVNQNTQAAETFEPLNLSHIHQLRDAVLAGGSTLCADCDGRCGRAAGTKAKLGDLARLLTYHEQFGARRQARLEYAELTDEERDWWNADLQAARSACPNRLPFAELMPRIDRLMS